jgi:cell division protein FtsB
MNEKIMKQEAQYDWLKDEVHCLNYEVNKLQQRIDWVINYIQHKCYRYSTQKCINTLNCEELDELLNILKGVDING